jgi:hypothetical protein
MGSIDERVDDQSRRAFVKKAAYIAPVILTLKAVPAFASQGSGRSDSGTGDQLDQQSLDDPPVNPGPSISMEPPNPPQSAGRRRRWWWFLVPFRF